MLYLVSYDLNKPIQNYTLLFEELKKTRAWWHHLDSTWIIKTTETIENFTDRIKAKIDSNDTLLVVDISADRYKGWLVPKAWEWLKENING
jgi:hypothetical protein